MKHTFGGDWTEEKLSKLSGYLDAYTKILRNTGLTTHYIDAFAGTGYRTDPSGERDPVADIEGFDVADDREEFLKGSAVIALDLEHPFDHYHFIDSKKSHVAHLSRLKQEYSEHKIQIQHADANDSIVTLCRSGLGTYHRGVVFLDPYGMEVEWSTIEAIAATRKLELWWLFPIGGLLRNLRLDELPPEPNAGTITRMLGTEEWKSAFYRPRERPPLFADLDTEDIERYAGVDDVAEFVKKRLRAVFAKVAPNHRILRNKAKNAPLYLLCFATSNPSPKAIGPAIRIANHLLKEPTQ